MDQVPSNVVLWTGLVGFLLPPVLAVVLQQGWSSQVKSVVAFLACVVAGFGLAYWQGNLDGADVATAALSVLTVAQATYQGFWKPTGIAVGIDAATSRKAA